MMILIYFWWAAKTAAGSCMRVILGDFLVWALGSKIGPKPPPRYTIEESSHQELSIGVITLTVCGLEKHIMMCEFP